MTQIIGIGGKLQHGKDVVADHLVDELGWVKVGMSDALNEILVVLNPLIVQQWEIDVTVKKAWWSRKTVTVPVEHRRTIRYADLIEEVGYVKAKEDPEVRRLLQVMGTEVGRMMIDPNIWTKMMTKKVRELKKKGVPGVIVTGIRFPNESKAIKTLGGSLWWVDRPGHVADSDSGSHDSENSLAADDFEVVIVNDRSLNDLRSKVDDLVD